MFPSMNSGDFIFLSASLLPIMVWFSGTLTCLLSLTGSPSWPHQVYVRLYTHSSNSPRRWLGPITFPLENHSFWIPQMPVGCQRGGAGHDAVGSNSSCRRWLMLFSLHILPGCCLADWLQDALGHAVLPSHRASILPAKTKYVMCTLLHSGSYYHTNDCSLTNTVEVEVALGCWIDV